ncbi:S1 RNA-binding domain-containing protein [Acetivibrio clariflavus]|uniref:Putative RNA-binding protein with ribosomal protein S1 domain n=1 Tax=Acetivibrio clariflavus (strain DSM 19732 / NBRC 101661 / EBR45) TaxID=720554 RepID=G8M1Z3_ACECE|nr:S1 RNA-binding domain-containing protein [Acetivibrio clariflavus]AEV67076.1 putative RNA-binding protein with ribosomal protein S1 domain [Acetivibrio clariflavus DSM 19732]HOQ00349.1 S1 RNA-binding domain-containing protein [Acetivibrio clariflavus]HPU41265.1 S1 RNA-binding domain-containing protein [Acetivibrio clariflavus]
MLVEVGKIVEGKVSGITNFGAFVQLANGQTGLVHISEVADEYVKDIKAHLNENQIVKVKIISVDNNGKISLSIKKALDPKPVVKSSKPDEIDWNGTNNSNRNMTFEELISKFKKDSDEKLYDLKKNFESKRGGGGYRRSAQY